MNETTSDTLQELLDAALRVLPEYADKLDRLVQSALSIWSQREKRPDSLTQSASVVVGRDLDVFLNMALLRLGREFLALSEPLRQWVNRMSAILEEAPISEVQQLELRLRLTELEVKFGTAGQLLKQLNVL
jgi:hypothetical protein